MEKESGRRKSVKITISVAAHVYCLKPEFRAKIANVYYFLRVEADIPQVYV